MFTLDIRDSHLVAIFNSDSENSHGELNLDIVHCGKKYCKLNKWIQGHHREILRELENRISSNINLITNFVKDNEKHINAEFTTISRCNINSEFTRYLPFMEESEKRDAIACMLKTYETAANKLLYDLAYEEAMYAMMLIDRSIPMCPIVIDSIFGIKMIVEYNEVEIQKRPSDTITVQLLCDRNNKISDGAIRIAKRVFFKDLLKEIETSFFELIFEEEK